MVESYPNELGGQKNESLGSFDNRWAVSQGRLALQSYREPDLA